MPSKARNGNAPLGVEKLQIGKLDVASGFARTEDQLLRRTPVEPTNTGWINSPNGIIHQPKRFLKGGGGGVAPCILGKIKTDTINSTEDEPKKKLLEGFITGSGSSELLVADNLTPTIDDFVWVKVDWTAGVIDGVLQSGGVMDTVTVETGPTMPDDTIPTVDVLAGIAYIPLGGWISDGADEPQPIWVKQGCGSIQVFFCPGAGFFFGRDNSVVAEEAP